MKAPGSQAELPKRHVEGDSHMPEHAPETPKNHSGGGCPVSPARSRVSRSSGGDAAARSAHAPSVGHAGFYAPASAGSSGDGARTSGSSGVDGTQTRTPGSGGGCGTRSLASAGNSSPDREAHAPGSGRGSRIPGSGRGDGSGGGGGNFDIHDAEAFDLQNLRNLKFKLDEAVAAGLSQAEAAIWDLNRQPYKVDTDVLANAMLNIEALASVRMDGRPPCARDMFIERALCAVRGTEQPEYIARYERDRASLVYAVEHAAEPCTMQAMKEVHRRVLPEKHADKGGMLRAELVQVGGSRYHTFGEPYLMPKPEDVAALLEDLAEFVNKDGFLVVEQAALAHAQMINIHPFERGNGKMARVAVHYVLRNQGVAPRFLLPVTPTIVTSSHDYVAGINSCAIEVGTSAEDTNRRLNAWLAYFSSDCEKAVALSSRFIRGCEELIDGYRSQLNVRSDSSALALLNALPALPAFSAQMAAEALGCSFKRASEACKALLDAGIIEQVTPGRRNRVYSAEGIMSVYLEIDALR